MAKRRILIEDIADLLGIHRNSVANKVNGESSFSFEQSVKIQEKFFPDLELKYLFRKDAMVSKAETAGDTEEVMRRC